MNSINSTVLMSGANYFSVKELNPYSYQTEQPDPDKARAEHNSIKAALQSAGIAVTQVPAPAQCQDGVYTANWGLCIGDTVVLASLPNARQAEEPYAEAVLSSLGKKLIKAPYRFSGQGDALPCGDYIFAGSGYRTDRRMHDLLSEIYNKEVVSLETVPAVDANGKPIINSVSGWPDSFFYDIDLALSVLTSNLIAWCPDAFTLESQARLKEVPIEKIEVSLDEAQNSFACNLVSTGQTVIMSNRAPQLQSAIQAHGLETITLDVQELAKGGGFIRCTTLTLD